VTASPDGLVVLGASGAQAMAAIEALSRALDMTGVIAVDRDWRPSARARLQSLGARTLDADVVQDADRLASELDGSRLVASFVGPFFSVGTAPLELALRVGADYLDICDDVDATEALLALHERARAAERRALIGMGSSPGTVNVLVAAAVAYLDDPRKTTVKLAWTVDAADLMDPAVEHIIHGYASAIPGQSRVPDWDELAPELVEFPDPIGKRVVVRLGHPEILTLPRYLEVAEAINKGGIWPEEDLHFYWALARISSSDGAEIRALHRRYRELRGPTPATGSGLRIEVTVSDGRGLVFLSGSDLDMAEATGTPAAAGILMMLEGDGPPVGAWPPEVLSPSGFFGALRRVSVGGGGLTLFRFDDGALGAQMSISELLGSGRLIDRPPSL
jgi:hypothetical protein